MIETLLGHIKGVLGKSFLLAGLLPSALFLFAWDWYAEGGSALPRIVRGLVAAPATAAEEVVFAALLLLTGGLVFFACRGPVLRLFQSIDLKALAPLREWALRRQRSKWDRLRREIQENNLKLDAFLWSQRGFGLYRMHSPPRMPTEQEAAQASGRARAAVASLLAPDAHIDPTLSGEDHERAIADGLCQLYVVATTVYVAHHAGSATGAVSPPDSPPEDSPPDSPPADGPPPQSAIVAEEISEWRTLVDRPNARAVIDRAEPAFQSRWSRALAEFHNSYPQDRQWLRPTMLGNRMAALDDYAEIRYHINASTLWTRLAGILPKESRTEIADAQLSVEVLTNLSFGTLIFGAIVSLYSLWLSVATLRAHCRVSWTAAFASGYPHAVCPPQVVFNQRAAVAVALSALLWFVFYRGAVYAFSTVAEKMVRMIDLQRLRLIAALGYEFPKSIGEEMEILGELQQFFAQAVRRNPQRPLAPPPKGGGEARKDGDESPPDKD